MEKLKAHFFWTLASMIVISFASNAAETNTLYQFHFGPDCEFSKRINKDWVSADPREVSNAEDFLIHEAYHKPGFSSFYANQSLYAARTSCFMQVSAPAPTEIHHEATEAKYEEAAAEKKEAAEEIESEFLHQAKSKVFEVTPSVGFASSIASVKKMVKDGLSYRKVCEFLTSVGVPTKNKGKSWQPEMVRRLLSR